MRKNDPANYGTLESIEPKKALAEARATGISLPDKAVQQPLSEVEPGDADDDPDDRSDDEPEDSVEDVVV
ncbi:hypothetical protein [Burkholderia sp. Ed8]|uniref:hypothetical protein n=1 Tax=Burkholderia sp. Ed8 TaxID=3112957 RepID=UPI00345D1C37